MIPKLKPKVCNFIKKESLAQVFSCEHLFLKNTSGGCFYLFKSDSSWTSDT